MSNKLTQKRENFVNNLFQGMTQREAWVKAGYSSNYALAVIDTNACNLAKENKIQVRLEELRQAVRTPLIANMSERLELLTKIARHEVEVPISAGHKVAAIAEQNKMEHIYEAGGNIRNINVVFVIGKGYPEGE